MTTAPAAAVPAATPSANAPLQPRYDPLSGEERRNNPEWIRRNTGAWSPGRDDQAGGAQEIDPRYRERHYSFRDILESFNPIQHIPIVGQLYRDATGTQLHPIARIAGGAATGAVGFASAFANVALESATGRDLGGHLLNLVAPRQGDANRQLAGGSWIYDPSIGQSATTPTSADPTANMAAAPAPAAADAQVATRAQRRRAPQVAPPPAPPADAQAAAPASQSAPGSIVSGQALAAAAGGNPGLAPLQAQPGSALAQALSVQGVPAAQSAQGRNIQQYFALSGTRPPGPESARAVPLRPPAGSSPRLGQPVLASSDGAQAPQDGRPQQPGTPQGANPGADGNDRTWFTAAMLHGVERYRDARRTQDSEQPSVDVSE